MTDPSSHQFQECDNDPQLSSTRAVPIRKVLLYVAIGATLATVVLSAGGEVGYEQFAACGGGSALTSSRSAEADATVSAGLRHR